MAGVGKKGHRHVAGGGAVTQIDPVAAEPLVVVGVVVDLVRKQAMLHHVGMIDAGRCLLMPGGVLEALDVYSGLQAKLKFNQWKKV